MSPELSRYLQALGRAAVLGPGREATEKAFRGEALEARGELSEADLAELRRPTAVEVAAEPLGSRNAELYYPRSSGRDFVTCELFDVRAARDLRLQYDFDRNGWSVQVPVDEGVTTADAAVDQQWKEAAFIEG